jgi:hypothetical protein
VALRLNRHLFGGIVVSGDDRALTPASLVKERDVFPSLIEVRRGSSLTPPVFATPNERIAAAQRARSAKFKAKKAK